MNRLAIVKNSRKITIESLYLSLKEMLSRTTPISEIDLRNAWLLELRKHKEIFTDGWYLPPPHGIAVLFGTESNPNRLDFKSLRKEENWPKDNTFLDRKKGLVFLYGGPLSREGIMGDFELTLYFGKNKKIVNYLALHYNLIKEIVEFIKIGMTFQEVFSFSEKLFNKHGLVNAIVSITDPTSKNIGHTYPFVTEKIVANERKILISKNWNQVCKMLSNKRIFLNGKEKVVIKPGMAFTIEPGVKMKNREDLPFIAFHTVVVINKNGKKEWLTNFNKIFKLVGMDYMLK